MLKKKKRNMVIMKVYTYVEVRKEEMKKEEISYMTLRES